MSESHAVPTLMEAVDYLTHVGYLTQAPGALLVMGNPGSGKTVALEIIRRTFQRKGIRFSTADDVVAPVGSSMVKAIRYGVPVNTPEMTRAFAVAQAVLVLQMGGEQAFAVFDLLKAANFKLDSIHPDAIWNLPRLRGVLFMKSDGGPIEVEVPLPDGSDDPEESAMEDEANGSDQVADAAISLSLGDKNLYHGRVVEDWAERAALGCLADLEGRSGVGNELEIVDEEERDDMVLRLAAIIRQARSET